MRPGTAGPALDVLVIGGGQAGLAMGHHLAQRGLRFEIVDAGAEIGTAWRSRWDSLRLFTSGSEALEARQVVVATGPFQVPFIPPIAVGLEPGMYQVHSAHYRRPETVPSGKVLVVGAANSGCQIARELSATHRVELSAGHRLPVIPQRPLGRDIWTWATALRLDRVTSGSRLGRRLAGRDQVIGAGPRQLTRSHGIQIRPLATKTAGRTVTFSDGSAADFDAVVWATGFRADHTWIDIRDVHDQQGHILHTRGVTPSPGLYMLGLTWQHTRGSALLGWVGADAAFLAEQISPGQMRRSPGLRHVVT
jgi:putative flavoprotein involved in K+ transport